MMDWREEDIGIRDQVIRDRELVKRGDYTVNLSADFLADNQTETDEVRLVLLYQSMLFTHPLKPF